MAKLKKCKDCPFVQLPILLSPELAAKLRAYCKKYKLTASHVVEQLIAHHVS
jgi:hypothetical protein